MRLWAMAALAWAWMLAAATAAPVHPPVRTAHVEAELVPETVAAAPGGVLYVALRQKIIPGWHTYWRNPGDAGQATSLTWTLPAGWRAGGIVWPTPERFLTGPLMNYVYTDEVYLPVPIEVPANARPGQTAVLKAAAHWLVCKDVCIPEDANLSLTLPVAAGRPALDPRFGKPIEATLAAAPKPAGLRASFRLQGTVLKLSVVGAAVRGADVAHAYFYPFDGMAIDQSKPQKAERGRDGLTLALVPGEGFSEGKPPTHLAGVLSLGRRAYEIDARSGPLLPGAAGLTAPIITTEVRPDRPPGGGGLGGGLLAAAGLAFLGGLVLNLMPCVFPVLSMKAAALARHVESPEHARGEGLAFLAGVLASFLGLAGLLIAARAGGEAVGWGFQLQSPGVVAGLCLVMLAAGLNLSGVFEFGLSLQGAGAGLTRRPGRMGAFFTGVLAVVVAAPCTAPFMAPAIGWAVAQPWPIALTVFASLGLGLAAPFVLLSFLPGFFRALPKPGPWMDVLRRILAFPMYGAAAWLAWVFALEAGLAALPYLFAAALAVAFAAWLWGLAQAGARPMLPRLVALIAVLSAVPLGVAGARQSAPAQDRTEAAAAPGSLHAEPWSPERVAALQAAGKPVFVDFTAAWCVTCQLNERTALASPAVAEAFARHGAVYLKADWTNRDPRIAQALSQQGRSGVPLYLVYGRPGAEPKILPQLLTEGMVIQALDDAGGAPDRPA